MSCQKFEARDMRYTLMLSSALSLSFVLLLLNQASECNIICQMSHFSIFVFSLLFAKSSFLSVLIDVSPGTYVSRT